MGLTHSYPEVFMTTDKSPDFSETKRFLNDRLKDVAFLGRSIAEVNTLISFGVKSVKGLFESVRLMLAVPFIQK
jgi:ubiquinone biosynthesis protein COQ9